MLYFFVFVDLLFLLATFNNHVFLAQSFGIGASQLQLVVDRPVFTLNERLRRSASQSNSTIKLRVVALDGATADQRYLLQGNLSNAAQPVVAADVEAALNQSAVKLEGNCEFQADDSFACVVLSEYTTAQTVLATLGLVDLTVSGESLFLMLIFHSGVRVLLLTFIHRFVNSLNCSLSALDTQLTAAEIIAAALAAMQNGLLIVNVQGFMLPVAQVVVPASPTSAPPKSDPPSTGASASSSSSGSLGMAAGGAGAGVLVLIVVIVIVVVARRRRNARTGPLGTRSGSVSESKGEESVARTSMAFVNPLYASNMRNNVELAGAKTNPVFEEGDIDTYGEHEQQYGEPFEEPAA